MTDTGSVVPGCTEYVVLDAHDHKSIVKGNRIRVVDHVNLVDYYVLRMSDCTLHDLQDHNDQYIHIEVINNESA